VPIYGEFRRLFGFWLKKPTESTSYAGFSDMRENMLDIESKVYISGDPKKLKNNIKEYKDVIWGIRKKPDIYKFYGDAQHLRLRYLFITPYEWSGIGGKFNEDEHNLLESLAKYTKMSKNKVDYKNIIDFINGKDIDDKLELHVFFSLDAFERTKTNSELSKIRKAQFEVLKYTLALVGQKAPKKSLFKDDGFRYRTEPTSIIVRKRRERDHDYEYYK